MGFNKAFLAKKGVRPVTYVPLHGTIRELSSTTTPKNSTTEYFLYLSNLTNTLLPLLIMANQYATPVEHQIKMLMTNVAFKEAVQALDSKIVSAILDGKTHQMLFSLITAVSTQNAYIKIFDETLSDNDPDNYYMEREWRIIRVHSVSP